MYCDRHGHRYAASSDTDWHGHLHEDPRKGAGTFSSSSCTLSGPGTSASCSVPYTPTAVGTGAHTIAASYGGDTTHAGSSGTTAVVVTAKRSTSTSLSCTPATVVVGQTTT